MSTRHFIDLNQQYLGAFADGARPPDNAFEVPTPPQGVQQIWKNGSWIWPLSVLKARKQAALQARFQVALDAGMLYGGRVVQIREIDQPKLTAIAHEARWILERNAAWPSDFTWRMADNSYLPLPEATAMIALAEAARLEVYRLQRVKWAHSDAIAAAPDPETLDAIDIESGWQPL